MYSGTSGVAAWVLVRVLLPLLGLGFVRRFVRAGVSKVTGCLKSTCFLFAPKCVPLCIEGDGCVPLLPYALPLQRFLFPCRCCIIPVQVCIFRNIYKPIILIEEKEELFGLLTFYAGSYKWFADEKLKHGRLSQHQPQTHTVTHIRTRAHTDTAPRLRKSSWWRFSRGTLASASLPWSSTGSSRRCCIRSSECPSAKRPWATGATHS